MLKNKGAHSLKAIDSSVAQDGGVFNRAKEDRVLFHTRDIERGRLKEVSEISLLFPFSNNLSIERDWGGE